MTFQIYKLGTKEPVATVSCGLADFHPKVSKTANDILNNSPVDTVVYVRNQNGVQWCGKKQRRRIITDKT